MDWLEIIYKLVLPISGIISLIVYLVKLKSTQEADKSDTENSVKLLNQELTGKIDLLEERLKNAEYIINHLTTAGENLKKELNGVFQLMGNIDSEVKVLRTFTETSFGNIMTTLKEMKHDLKDLNK